MEMRLFSERGADLWRACRNARLGRPFASALVLTMMLAPISEVLAENGSVEVERRVETPQPISGRDPSVNSEILPADVLARSLLVGAELDLMCREMGIAKIAPRDLEISGAAPREVFYQAVTLSQKADRLVFEFTGSVAGAREIPNAGSIRPAHVWRRIDAALGQILLIKAHLGIREKSVEPPQDEGVTPTEVYLAILQLNRQMNLMLQEQFSPSDVFQETTLATNYAARLLSVFPGAERRPDPPAFERGKYPPDVYRRLTEISGHLQEIFETSELEMMELHVSEENIQNATPSDVYDIASLLVSELSYLHDQCQAVQPPAEAFYPGRKFPSHVYQRAGILEAQIEDLLERVNDNPGWLRRGE